MNEQGLVSPVAREKPQAGGELPRGCPDAPAGVGRAGTNGACEGGLKMATNAVRTGMLALAVLCALPAGRPPLAAGTGSGAALAAGSAEAVQEGAGPAAKLVLAQAATDAGPPPPRAIREAQALLSGLGYAPGPADGVWGRRTGQAYRAFLRDAGLPAAERLTPEALRAMRAIAQKAGVTPGSATTGTPRPAASTSRPAAAVLHRAAQAGDIAGLQAALSAGAEVDARDGRGWTALMHAVSQGYILLVEPLLEAGASPDVRAPDGATALFMAAVLGHTEVIELLSNRGADVSVKGPKGKTAVDVARTRYGDVDVARENGEPPAVLSLLQGETLEGMRRKAEVERRKAEVERRKAEERERRRVEKAEEHKRLAEAGKRLARKWPAGTKLRECKKCPELVVVPPGSFMMGSPAGESEREDDEGPVHRVTLLPFAVGVNEVTRGEFARFVSATGHSAGNSCWTVEDGEWKEKSGRHWKKPGFSQTDGHPVVCVSWEDAKSYVRWLSRETGEGYRLLSESEWEYAARAGTTGPFHTGPTISTKQANYNGNHTYGSGRKGRYRGKTTKVGSYPANDFGLHDVHGNVWEWVEDCWNGSYEGAPEDGSARESGDCARRVLRGGSWGADPQLLRSAFRGRNTTGDRYDFVGFRVARTLD